MIVQPPPEDLPRVPGPAAPADRAPSLHAGWRVLVRTGAVLVLGLSCGIALLGALVTHWTGMLVFAPLLGAAAAAVVALVGPSSRPALVHAAVAGTVLVPFANGLVLLGSAGGALLLALLTVGPLLLLGWSAAEDTPVGRTTLPELLQLLPTAELIEEWRATEELHRDPAQRSTASVVRAALLDELSRRDPDGVAAWLAGGDPVPDRYIRTDRDLAG
ncbi:hypothetical protein [Blastococcus sp. SYSU D01042]